MSVLARVLLLLLLLLPLVFFQLPRQPVHGRLVLGEGGVHGQVHFAVEADAAQLPGDVVDDGLPAVVELGLAQLPWPAVADHVVELVDGGDEGKLRVLEYLGVALVLGVSRDGPHGNAERRTTDPLGSCLYSTFLRTPVVQTTPSSLHRLHGNSPSHCLGSQPPARRPARTTRTPWSSSSCTSHTPSTRACGARRGPCAHEGSPSSLRAWTRGRPAWGPWPAWPSFWPGHSCRRRPAARVSCATPSWSGEEGKAVTGDGVIWG